MFAMTSSPCLVIVRHALAVVDRSTAPQDWPLSDQGRSDAEALFSQIDLSADVHLVSSDELKARQTAEALSSEFVTDRRLREASRPWVDGAEYHATAKRWLDGECVDGWEPQSDVVGRMSEAVDEAATRGGNDVCLVSHGLAISVLVADLAGVDPTEFWPRLRFPDYVRINLRSSPVSFEHGGAK